MKLPQPGTEEFNKLGPEARTLARWRHQTTPIRENQETQTQMEKFAK